MTDLLSPGEVAKRFRVTPKTIARWADAGKLRFTLTLGGHRRFSEAELEEDMQIMRNKTRKENSS